MTNKTWFAYKPDLRNPKFNELNKNPAIQINDKEPNRKKTKALMNNLYNKNQRKFQIPKTKSVEQNSFWSFWRAPIYKYLIKRSKFKYPHNKTLKFWTLHGAEREHSHKITAKAQLRSRPTYKHLINKPNSEYQHEKNSQDGQRSTKETKKKAFTFVGHDQKSSKP